MKKTLLALAAALLSSAAHADTLITNVNGIQVGADGKLQRFRALAISDDGKVRQVIENPELVRLANITRTIDMRGRTMLPGLIDAHGHIFGLGYAKLTLDLVGTTSVADLQQRLATHNVMHIKGWIVGRGWNQELWSDKRFPTAADLDKVVSDRPVVLERVDGHAVVANSAALKAAGISARTKDPSGGKIERDPSGRPTGLLIDSAAELVSSKVPKPTAAERDRALIEAQRALLGVGITAAADMGTSVPEWQSMLRAARAGNLQVRIMSYAAGMEPLATLKRPTSWLHADRLRFGGVKLYADGALGSRGAWLKQPYADMADTHGLRFRTDAEMFGLAKRAADAGFQVAIHAIGDAANAQELSVFERLSKMHPGDRRWRIEHAQVVDPRDIPRFAPAGVIASMQPVHQTSDRLMAEKRLGPDRLGGAYAWQTVLRSGARLAFGSDFPVEAPNPFPGLAAAISRQDMAGEPTGGWLPQERVTFAQALHGFTQGAAYGGFAENKIGSLEPGKWADFIFVDQDVSAVDPQTLARTKVFETWVAGKKVYAIREGAVLIGHGERGSP